MSVDLKLRPNLGSTNSNLKKAPAQAQSRASSSTSANTSTLGADGGSGSMVFSGRPGGDSVKISGAARSRDDAGQSASVQAFSAAFEQGSAVSQPASVAAMGGDGGGRNAQTTDFAEHAIHEGKKDEAPSLKGADGGAGDTSAPKVILIDEFGEFSGQGPNDKRHGDGVEAKYRTKDPSSDLEVIGSEMVVKPGGQVAASSIAGENGLDNYLNGYFEGQLNNADKAWQQVLAEEDKQGPNQRTVVSQSQGTSDSRVVGQLLTSATNDANTRHELERQLGLPESKGEQMSKEEKTALAKALVEKTSQIHHSDKVQQAADKLHATMGEAGDKGAIHTISSGNEGELAKTMKELGVELPDDFFKNELAGPDSIIVGNADAMNPSDLKPAHDASPGVGTDISANGECHKGADGQPPPGALRGSSMATPQIAAKVREILAQDPSLSRDEVLKRLQEMAVPVPGQEDKLGAGVVM